MRCHPDFETKIVPHIKQVFQKISNTSDRLELLTQQMPPFLENKL
jgi:hypothetical protein